MATRLLTIDFCLGWSFGEGLGAATMPRRLWSRGAEPSGERPEDIAIGTGRRQEDTDAGRPLHHARGDFDQTKAYRGELCRRQLRATGYVAAHGEHQPIGSGVNYQAELVGFGLAA
jgi:hypothetical protein